MHDSEHRIIGRYTGEERGPLMIVIGGLHGNETAGVRAIDMLFKMLEVEPITNAYFQFSGRLVGLKGNVKALQLGQRFISMDMNRIWTQDIIDHVIHQPVDDLCDEFYELRSLIDQVDREIADYQPHHVVVLDLHTTSSPGGVFTIVRDDLESIRLGMELHAPVIRGMLEGLDGTLLHYYRPENFDVQLSSVTFESGQHHDPLSMNRAIAGIINCLRTSEMVRAEHVENRHDALLLEHVHDLPLVNHLMYIHHTTPDDGFKMVPGFRSFDRVYKNMLIASDHKGPIQAKMDGYLLMPRYQPQGDDGFFIIKESESPAIKKMIDEIELHFSCKVNFDL